MTKKFATEGDVTRDTLFAGRITLFQPKHGYRTNVDALHLAAFAARGGKAATVFDLGSGVGTVALGLLDSNAASRVVLVERDAVAAALAQKNLETNGFADRGEVMHRSVEHVNAAAEGAAGLVVCNPPYQRPDAGRPPKAQTAAARTGALGPFVKCAKRLLGRRGRACFVYPATNLAFLLAELNDVELHVKRMCFVQAREELPARIVLVDARAGRPGGTIVEPCFIERNGAKDSDALRSLLSG